MRTAQPLSANRQFLWLVMLGVMILGSGVRLAGTAQRSLWFDEAFSWRMATFSPPEIIVRAAADNNPPLYYLLLKLWIALFGDSSLALRTLSVAAGVTTCLGTYLFVREGYASENYGVVATLKVCADAGGKRAHWMAACAAAMTAFSTFQIRWAWEARMYTLGAACAVLSSWLLLRALRAEWPAYGRWALYATAAIIFLYIHTYACFSVAAQWIFILGSFLQPRHSARLAASTVPRFGGALLAAALIALAWAPWLGVLTDQAAHVRQAFWSRPLDRWQLPHYCYQMLVAPENPHLSRPTSLLAAGACAAVLLQLLWRPRAADWLIFLMAVVPLVGGLVVSLAVTNVIHPRYLFFAHTFLLIALARLVGRTPRRSERTVITLVVLANMLLIHAAFIRRLKIAERPGVRAAAKHIEEQRQGDAPVIVASPFFFTPVLYHLEDRANCYLFDGGDGLVHYQGTAALKTGDCFVSDRLASLRAGQVWIVNNRSGGGWGDSKIVAPGGWTKVESRTFREPYDVQGTVEVVEYRVR